MYHYYYIYYIYIIFNSVISLTQFTRWLGRKLQQYLPKAHRHRGRNMGQGQQTIPGSCLTQRATRDPWFFAWTITSFSSIIRDFGSPGISSLCFLSLTTNKQAKTQRGSRFDVINRADQLGKIMQRRSGVFKIYFSSKMKVIFLGKKSVTSIQMLSFDILHF